MTKATQSHTRRGGFRSVSWAILAIALSGVVLAACGAAASPSSTKSTTTTTAPPTSSTTAPPTSSTAANAAFTACLKQHGVTGLGKGPGFGGGAPPTGSTSGTKPTGGAAINSKTRAALQACARLRPKGSGFAGRSGVTSTAFAAFRNCMTLHGVTLATRGSKGAPSASPTVTSSPTYKKAFAACSTLLPAPSTTTTSPSA